MILDETLKELRRDIEKERRRKEQAQQEQARRDRQSVVQAQLYEYSKRWR